MKLLHRLQGALSYRGRVTFCDSCSQVCDQACRAAAARQRTLTQVTNTLPIRL